MKKNAAVIVCLFLFSALCYSISRAEVLPDAMEIKHYEGIAYISGGIGYDEREALKATGKAYSLKILFSVKGGELLSDLLITVTDEKGKIMLKAAAEGPLFYARVAPGKYTVTASMMEKAQTRQVQISSNAQASLHFVWNQ